MFMHICTKHISAAGIQERLTPAEFRMSFASYLPRSQRIVFQLIKAILSCSMVDMSHFRYSDWDASYHSKAMITPLVIHVDGFVFTEHVHLRQDFLSTREAQR